ncbi:hypothetical protein PAXINDRAFT_18803 [Paxillus involutus ATCC 200175]|uniref:Uncharacterized protein n=1 Tax=Paxillus involutus ATCC 200175 TaxID=664439 RepID=A0A0C9TA99_PAXIN|nr:hypothetical protein PAXINDRAFT_18803 [Paxillus involutus ATCC 200175]
MLSSASRLEPTRAAFLADGEWQKIEQLAYPDPNAKEPKKKARKGNNAKAAPAQVDGDGTADLPAPPSEEPDGTAVSASGY